jgi:hypothetical protein
MFLLQQQEGTVYVKFRLTLKFALAIQLIKAVVIEDAGVLPIIKA